MRIAEALKLPFRYLFSFVMLSTCLMVCQIANAQYSRPVIEPGMRKSEVQARWGQPKTVIERALKSETIWEYAATEKLPQQTVFFHTDKVVNITGGIPMSPQDIALNQPKLRASKKFTKAEAFMPIVSHNDLNEVLKQIPSEDEESGKITQEARSPAKFE